MVIRLSAFYQSLREGQFPVRFLGRLNNSYGYPVANFLYPGFLYIGSILHVIGFSFVDAIKIIFGFSVLGSSLFLYLVLRRHFSLISSATGVFSFLVSPYLLFDMYSRGSVGEILSFLSFFASLWAMQTSTLWLLPLGIALLVVSHNSLAALFFLVLIGFLLRKKRFHLLPSVCIGIGLAAFFWLPALYEKQFVLVDSIVISDVLQYFVQFRDIYLYGVGIIALLVLILRRLIRFDEDTAYYALICIIGVFFSLSPSFFLWQSLHLGFFLQFPFRFLSLVVLSSPFIVSRVIEISPRKIIVSVFFAAISLILVIPIFSGVRFVNRPEGYYVTNEATTTVKNEFMPRWVLKMRETRPEKRLELYQGKGSIEVQEESTNRIRAVLDAYEPLIVQVNTVYYPGWGASLDGESLTLEPSPLFGFIHMRVPAGKHALVLEFRETPFRFIADSISFISLLIYGCMKKRNGHAA
jgi:hypothetical protein